MRPGGCVGVFRASGGNGGGGPAGGGDVGDAYGLVMYEASEVIEGIGSRNAALPDLCRRWPMSSFGDLLADRFDFPLPSLDDEELPEFLV